MRRLLPLILRISRKIHYPTPWTSSEKWKIPSRFDSSSPPPSDRSSELEILGAMISMAEDRRRIYNTPERGEKFYACAFDKGFGSFRNNTRAIWSARKPGVFYVQPQRWHIANRLRKQLSKRWREGRKEGRKVDGIERQRSLLCVYRFYGDRKKVWRPLHRRRDRIVDYRWVRQISIAISVYYKLSFERKERIGGCISSRR